MAVTNDKAETFIFSLSPPGPETTEAEGGHPVFYFVISYSTLQFSSKIPIAILFSILRWNI